MENQLALDNFIEGCNREPMRIEHFKEKFRNRDLYIGKDGTVHVKDPFCPHCGCRHHTKHGTSEKVTIDIIGENNYLPCQRYLCGRCERPYSAYIKNIVIYDETEIYDLVIEEVNQKIANQIKTNGNVYQLGTKIFDMLQQVIFNNIEIDLSSRAQYKKEDILELMVRNSISTDYLETTRNLMDLTTTFHQSPSADTVLLYIGKKKRQDIKVEFDGIFRKLINYLHSHNILTRPMDIAIDIHDQPYHGKLKNQDVIKGRKKSGTRYFHKFLTVDSVEQDQRFTFAASHFTQFDDRFRVFQDLLSFLTQNRVEIQRLYVDREFFNTPVINYLVNEEIPFIMPAKREDSLKEIANKHWSNGELVFDHCFYKGTKNESCHFTVFLIANTDHNPSKPTRKGNEEFYLFATNIAIKLSDHRASQTKTGNDPDDDGEDRSTLSDYYRKRWGIETDYRVLEHNFQAKTTSNKFSIRYFNFLSGVALRNLWELSKILFKPLYERLFPKKTMTAKLWSRVLELFLDAKRLVNGLSSIRSKLLALKG